MVERGCKKGKRYGLKGVGDIWVSVHSVKNTDHCCTCGKGIIKNG